MGCSCKRWKYGSLVSFVLCVSASVFEELTVESGLVNWQPELDERTGGKCARVIDWRKLDTKGILQRRSPNRPETDLPSCIADLEEFMLKVSVDRGYRCRLEQTGHQDVKKYHGKMLWLRDSA